MFLASPNSPSSARVSRTSDTVSTRADYSPSKAPWSVHLTLAPTSDRGARSIASNHAVSTRCPGQRDALE